MLLREAIEEVEMLKSLIDEADGEMTPDLETRLDAMTCVVETKVESLCDLIADIQGGADAIHAEIDRLSKMLAAKVANVRRIKDWLKTDLENAGLARVVTPLRKVSVCRNSRPSITWSRPDEELPNRFQRVRVELDGQRAYEEYKSDGDLPDGFSVREGTHLRIT